MQERGKHCFDIEATFETWRQSRRRPTRRQELAASQTVFRYWTASSGHHVSAAEVSSSSWREHLLTSELKLLQENWPSTWDWIDLSAFPLGAQWPKNIRMSWIRIPSQISSIVLQPEATARQLFSHIWAIIGMVYLCFSATFLNHQIIVVFCLTYQDWITRPWLKSEWWETQSLWEL